MVAIDFTANEPVTYTGPFITTEFINYISELSLPPIQKEPPMKLIGCGKRECIKCILIPLSEECDKYTEENELEYKYGTEHSYEEDDENIYDVIRDRFGDSISIREYCDEDFHLGNDQALLNDAEWNIYNLRDELERYNLQDITLEDCTLEDEYISCDYITLIFYDELPKGLNILGHFRVEDNDISGCEMRLQLF